MSIRSEAAPTGGSERQGLNGRRIHSHSTRPRRLYLAAPLSARDDSEHYPACRNLVAATWPEAEVVEGIREFAGPGDWQRRSPALIRNADRLVFVPRPDGTIGAGVLREIVEAVFWHVPVHLATVDRLIPVEDATFRILPRASSDRFATVTVEGR